MDAAGRTKLSPGEVRALVAALAASLGGQPAGPFTQDEVNAVVARMAVQTLSLIREDFLRKARGGTGEGGDQWAPLKPETIARRKRTRREQADYARAVKQAKRNGQKPPTKLAFFGARQVEILRDLGLLLNSLTPGSPGDAAAADPLQVFRVEPGMFTVGSRRQGAGAHHRGVPHRNLPQRRLWPERLPPRWWDLIIGQGRDGLTRLLQGKLR